MATVNQKKLRCFNALIQSEVESVTTAVQWYFLNLVTIMEKEYFIIERVSAVYKCGHDHDDRDAKKLQTGCSFEKVFTFKAYLGTDKDLSGSLAIGRNPANFKKIGWAKVANEKNKDSFLKESHHCGVYNQAIDAIKEWTKRNTRSHNNSVNIIISIQ